MRQPLSALRHSLVAKIILAVGATLLLCTLILVSLSVNVLKSRAMEERTLGADRLGRTIMLGARHAMMTNARDRINAIIRDVGRQEDIVSIRIYNKEGTIMFAGHDEEVGRKTDIKDRACVVCHLTDPPTRQLTVDERTRVFTTAEGEHLLGTISPIYNDEGCDGGPCHFHPSDKIVLGALDVVLSMREADKAIAAVQYRTIGFGTLIFFLSGGLMTFFLVRFVKKPIAGLTQDAVLIGQGLELEIESGDDRPGATSGKRKDELGKLATAIHKMSEQIHEKRLELDKQKEQYRQLFMQVPCFISVLDKDYKLIEYNREFEDRFCPQAGDHCWKAFKDREEKCPNCPVERTFETGKPQFSEESGVSKDGSPAHWIVHTAPIFNDEGEVTAAMEMCLDITARKKLADRLRESEEKYHAIFDNIPQAVFVLSEENFSILDHNITAETMYKLASDDLKSRTFLDLVREDEREAVASHLRAFTVINRVPGLAGDGSTFFMDILLSPSRYDDEDVLLVATNDISERLEAEQKVIHAGKMATLGEMATGVAHELNQPLTVIKSAGSFFMKKIKKNEPIPDEVLMTLAKEIDSHVERAVQIINHMREFGRKTDLVLEPTDVNDVLKKSFAFFGRQLAVRDIEVIWELEDELPPIMASPNRLEQVFINLLTNARDALENIEDPNQLKHIIMSTRLEGSHVVVELCDNGHGIPKHLLSKVFEPFFTTKKVGKGTGLGLSISYGMVKDFGGSIKAVNKTEESGACFIMRFPKVVRR